MAIYLTDNFKLGVKRLLDERTNISTLQELEDMATTFIPYGLIVHCDEDDNMYKFINDNGVDKWITLTMSIESLFFEYNNETEKYDFFYNWKLLKNKEVLFVEYVPWGENGKTAIEDTPHWLMP